MKNKLRYYPISQGHIIASWYILYLVAKYESIHPKDVNSLLQNSGKLGGKIPAEQGLKICIDYNLVRFDEQKLCLTELSQKHITPLCDKDDPNTMVLRVILGHIVSLHNFQWLIFYDSDPDIFKAYLYEQESEWVVLLENAKLFDFEDESVNTWWSNVLSKYEDYKEALKKAIGDVGEKLTYIHELERIDKDGHTPAKSFVKWASRINDHFGFDVLSIRGKRFVHTYKEREKIQIEVKSSDTSNIESFRFYISKPEWKTALKNLHTYFFYCWPGINVSNESALGGPFIIPAVDLMEHMPQDVSPISEWSECRCVLDISKYKLS